MARELKKGIIMKSDKKPVAELTEKEAYAVAVFIDRNLLDYIRSDTDIDSMDWLKSILHAYEKMCKASGFVGLTESAEGEDDSD
jgi:hypothetical protein